MLHGNSRARALNDLRNLCRALWFFHAMKEQKRKTTSRINDKSVKAKNCGGIQGQADPAPTVTPSGVPPCRP